MGFEASHPVLVPLFAEARGYLLRRQASPFYALGAGMGWSIQNPELSDYDVRWRGGAMAQMLLGYRFGRSLTLHTGVRWQHARATAPVRWWGGAGIREIQYWRFMLGVGYLL